MFTAEPADYIRLSAGVHTFTPETGLSRSVLVATVLDDITEAPETFLVRITGVTTDCPFNLQNSASTVTIRDRESKFSRETLSSLSQRNSRNADPGLYSCRNHLFNSVCDSRDSGD